MILAQEQAEILAREKLVAMSYGVWVTGLQSVTSQFTESEARLVTAGILRGAQVEKVEFKQMDDRYKSILAVVTMTAPLLKPGDLLKDPKQWQEMKAYVTGELQKIKEDLGQEGLPAEQVAQVQPAEVQEKVEQMIQEDAADLGPKPEPASVSERYTGLIVDVRGIPNARVTMLPRIIDDTDRRIYGIEVLLRHALQGRFFGWISYTLMRSERQDAPGEPYRLFDFDQTHILAAVAQYRLPANWEIGARWRYVTGNPVTLFSRGPYDVNADVFVGKPGEINATRLPAFHQLDLRVDRKWIWDLWYLTAYFEIQNVYNRQNPETYTYRYDFSDREIVSGLPILPSFGLRGSF